MNLGSCENPLKTTSYVTEFIFFWLCSCLPRYCLVVLIVINGLGMHCIKRAHIAVAYQKDLEGLW